MLWLLRFLPWWSAFALLLAGLYGITGLFSAVALGEIFRSLGSETLEIAGLVFFLLLLAQLILKALSRYLFTLSSHQLGHRIRLFFSSKIDQSELTRLENLPSGEVVHTACEDSEEIVDFAEQTLFRSVSIVLNLVTLGLGGIFLNTGMGTVLLASLLPALIAAEYFRRQNRDIQKAFLQSNSELSQESIELLRNAAYLKREGYSAWGASRFFPKLRSSYSWSIEQLKLSSLMGPALQFLSYLPIISIIFVGTGQLGTVTEAALFVTYLRLAQQLSQPIRSLLFEVQGSQRSLEAADRLATLAEKLPSLRELERSPSARMKFELREAEINLGQDTPLVRSLNLEIKAGESLVLLGRSGSGKTLIADTLAGIRKLHVGTYLAPQDYEPERNLLYLPQNSFFPQLSLLEAFESTPNLHLKIEEYNRWIKNRRCGTPVSASTLLPEVNKTHLPFLMLFMNRHRKDLKLAILDEVSSSMNSREVKNFHELFRKLFPHLPAIFVSHNPEDLRYAQKSLSIDTDVGREWQFSSSLN